MNKYWFHRDFYSDVQNAISSDRGHAVFILGPRKCGKTICMKQLATDLSYAVYYDVKQLNDEEQYRLLDTVVQCVHNNEKRVFLVDEVTYWDLPEKMIAKVAGAFTDCRNTNTKVVFAGSQSVALKSWANRTFAGNATLVSPDFLSYTEWLAYKNLGDISAETFSRFVIESRDFYENFVSLDQYLQGCLEETVMSNYKTSNVIFDNDCTGLTTDILKNVLYSTLVAQADRSSLQSFFDTSLLSRKIRYSFSDAYRRIGEDKIRARIDKIFTDRLRGYISLDFELLRKSFLFLYKCGLLTLTYVTSEASNFENIINVAEDLGQFGGSKIRNKEDLFSRVNACIKYPMFYVELLKEILGEYFPQVLGGDILGGIVECLVRGILPQENCYEYHSADEHEVDYVNFVTQKAIEISVRNKGRREVYFDDLPESFSRVLLTKDQDFVQRDGLKRVPYFKFIADHSPGKRTLF